MAEIGHLCRTPLGRRQLRVHLYSSAWPIFNVLAAIYRRTITRRTRVVAVVGSYGKTTTARAIGYALGLKRINLSGKGVSQVALSILRMLPGQPHGVIEVAVNRRGQMLRHAKALRPNVVILTSIGSEHHRSLGDKDAIRNEKSKILKGLSTCGVVIFNGDDPQLNQMQFPADSRLVRFGFDAACEMRASDVSIDWPRGTCFTLHVNQETHWVRTRLLGRKMVYPILAVLALALAEGRSLAETIAAVETIPPADGRMQLVPLTENTFLLRDEHKSSLETIDAALDVLSEIPARRLVVFGDISEPPGSQGPIYRRLGGRIAAMASYAIFVGEHFRQYARGARRAGLPSAALFNAGKNLDAAVDALRRQLHPGDVVLIKGRNTQRMERISLALMGQTVNCKIEFCNAMGTRCYRCPMLIRGWKPNEVWPVGK
jgi:UDP-N-acetylmuramoyl-tripeptide--D-alanyl-D-alanine ligase